MLPTVEARNAVDYWFVIRLAAVFSALLASGFYWNPFLRRLNRQLQAREAELVSLDYGATEEQVSRYLEADRTVLETGKPLFIPQEADTRTDRTTGWFQTTKTPYKHPDWDKPAILGVSIDITERVKNEELVRHMAQHDGLTGLPNRALFTDRLGQALAMARRSGTRVALLFVDLNGFKPVNDTHGHGVGDLVLKETARRLLDSVRESDGVGRIGGDEFVVFLQRVDTRGQVEKVSSLLLQILICIV